MSVLAVCSRVFSTISYVSCPRVCYVLSPFNPYSPKHPHVTYRCNTFQGHLPQCSEPLAQPIFSRRMTSHRTAAANCDRRPSASLRSTALVSRRAVSLKSRTASHDVTTPHYVILSAIYRMDSGMAWTGQGTVRGLRACSSSVIGGVECKAPWV
jgi:hypothetical protein